MLDQKVMIGIAVGVFFAGLGVGLVILQSSQTVTPQQMQRMVNDPQMMNQWHQQMMQNPQAMNNWMNTMMNDPQAMQQMHDTMMNNPQHMQSMVSMMDPNMMSYMLKDPQSHQQMMGTMMGNQQFMNQMMANPQFHQNWMGPWMTNSSNLENMMRSGWMNQEMMSGSMMRSGMMSGHMMMGPTITEKNEVLVTISNIEKILEQTSEEYRDGNKDTAFSLATNAYLENYEYIEGAIAQKDRPLMEKIEMMMRVDLRTMIKNGESVESIDAKISSIKTELNKAKTLF